MSAAHVEAALDLLSKLRFPTEAHIYVFGGIAVAWWTDGVRPTADIDAVFVSDSFPENPVTRNDLVFLDGTFNDTLPLLQEDYMARAPEILVSGNVHIHMADPVDLVCTKLSRHTPRDMEDIGMLLEKGLVNLCEFRRVAGDALVTYVGNPVPVRDSIDEVARMLECACHP